MVKIKIKPLSINEAYRGRRFATPKLKAYKEMLGYLFPKKPTKKISKREKLQVKYVFGVSSKGGDFDNLVKCFQDCLAEHYGFNDNQIYRAEIEKKIVEKEQEYIEFEIAQLQDLN